MPLRRTGIPAIILALVALLALAAPTPALAEDVASTETTTVTVELATFVEPEGDLSDGQVDRQRDRIDDAQDDVLDLVDTESAQRHETIPFVTLEVTAEELAALEASDAVADVEPVVAYEATLDQSVSKIRANDPALAAADGAGHAVAVLDTGVDASHVFLQDKVVDEACFTVGDATTGNDCPSGSSTQFGAGAAAPCTYTSACDHGTHVAGIAAGGVLADAHASTPARGVASGAKIVAAQVFVETAAGGASEAWSNDLASALEWVLLQHANPAATPGVVPVAAVNMSLGGGSFPGACDTASGNASIKAAIDQLRSFGVPTVISSGNSGSSTAMSSPACISTAVSVGSSGTVGDPNADVVSDFTNVSPMISLLAPGKDIVSSDADISNPTDHDDFESKQGTSMAAPHVAGAWAVMRHARAANGFAYDVVTELAAFRASGVLVDDTITQDIPRIDVLSALRPATPTNVGVLAGAGDATVSWSSPSWTGGGAITGFEVDVWPTLTPGVVTTHAVAAGASSFVVPSLAVPGDHTFAVRAVNALGDGATSAGVTASTPPGAPSNVVATAGSSRASVTWTASSDGGSPITDYRVTVAPADGVASPTRAVGSPTTGLDFTGLANGSTYTFTVTAVNAVGESVASAPSNAVAPRSSSSGSGGGGGGGGGGSGTTTTSTTQPRTTTTTTPPPEPTPQPEPEPDPEPVAYPGAAVSFGRVVTLRDGQVVTITSGAPAGADVVGGAVTPSGAGAWAVTSDGRVFTSGDAAHFGDVSGSTLNAPIVGIAPTPTGKGYWLLGRDGGIFTYGDAAFFGSTGGRVLNQPVVGMSSTPTGRGYWLFAGDGGIFTFGDARFFGSTGAQRLNAPVTTMAATPSARGYWLLGADGGVFTFGDAAFFGSTGGRTDVGAIEAIVPSRSGRGYALIGFDGRVHRFGDA